MFRSLYRKHCPKRRQERRDKRKRLKAETAKTEVQQANKSSRYVPAKIRDQVFIRDGYQCTYVANGSTRCDSKHNLHIDHIQPHALGGTSEIDNLRLLCAAHNQMLAKEAFGEEFIQSKISNTA